MSKMKRHKRNTKKSNPGVALRGCLTVLAELCGIAGFLLAVYIFLKGELIK
jgi:hypothetical protein